MMEPRQPYDLDLDFGKPFNEEEDVNLNYYLQVLEKVTRLPTTLKTNSKTVVVYARKDRAETKLGLALQKVGDRIMVTNIAHDGLLANQQCLRVGTTLKAFNNIACDTMKAKEVMKMVNAAVGEISLTAEENDSVVYVKVKRTALNNKLGLYLVERAGQIYVADIIKTGLFGKTSLRNDMLVIAVCHQSCAGLSLDEAVALFQTATAHGDEITVLAEDVGYIKVSVEKEANTYLGLGLKATNDGRIFIACIDPMGTFGGCTDLGVGLRIVRINNTEMRGKTANQAGEIMKNTVGTLNILAEQSGMEKVTVTKPNSKSRVGISLTNKGDGNVYVSGIAPGSLFEGTAIRMGLRLVSVNGQMCSGRTAASAGHLFENAQGDITVLAEDPELFSPVANASTSSTSSSSLINPLPCPPGTRPGGVWGLNTYAGPKTKRKACLAVPFLRQQHLDYRIAYKVGGIVYDEKGEIIGLASEVAFRTSSP